MADVLDDAERVAELRAIVQTIQDRVRSEYPETSAPLDREAAEPISIPLADLMPLVHARDAAQAKMAALGNVNPRPPGLVNDTIQRVKRGVSRGLGWFVRDQIVFNRGAMECVEATLEALNEMNRSLVALAAGAGQAARSSREAAEAAAHKHNEERARFALQWTEARGHMEGRAGEMRASLEDLRRRLGEMEAGVREHAAARAGEYAQQLRAQHAEFELSLAGAATAIQKNLARDLQAIRLDAERLIHNELRVPRQRGQAASPAPASHADVPIDYQAFSHRFRGSEEYVKQNQVFYVERFRGLGEILDIGCGQGEFLEVMREQGLPARGIDSSAAAVANCQAKGLEALQADLFDYLVGPGDLLDGIFCSQVVEHLPGNRIPELIGLCAARLRSGGLLALETPNPECLAIFATHFYLDPTHIRPVPSALLAFYMEEHGLGGIEVHPRFPAADSYPELRELPAGVRERFFGGLDYAIFARKL